MKSDAREISNIAAAMSYKDGYRGRPQFYLQLHKSIMMYEICHIKCLILFLKKM